MRRLDKLSEDYEDARDAAYASDALKEKIDRVYVQLMKGRQTRKMRR
jgi:hypothetical protein